MRYLGPLLVLCVIWSNYAVAFEVTINTKTTNVELSVHAPYQYISPQHIQKQVEQNVELLEAFYGQFPVSSTSILFQASEGNKPIRGTVYGGEHPFIVMKLVDSVPLDYFENDWILVHEMVHLALPNVTAKHYWLAEGIATYIEPFVRRDGGIVDNDYIWRWLKQGLPNAVRDVTQKGLDHSPNWAQLYWGSTLYCFLVDIDIRQQTQGNKSLRDALQGILKSVGGMRVDATIEEILKAGDEATQTNAFAQRYHQMGKQKYQIDLEKVWESLGIKISDSGELIRNNEAPLAWVRQALETKNTPALSRLN